MKKYVVGVEALNYWEVPGLKDSIFLPSTEKKVVFSERDTFKRRNAQWCSLIKAEKYTDNGFCTLPYVFLNFAKDLRLLPLIYLGMQICAKQDGKLGKPLCTVRRLRECALSLRGHPGRRKALRAVQYICENSFSPMEAWLYMLLCLPNHLGGCGFPNPILNQEIRADKKKFYVDMFFPKHRVAIEYDSYQHHNNPESFSYDSARDMELKMLGIDVIHVRPHQLRNIEDFYNLSIHVSRSLKKSIRIRTTKYFNYFNELYFLFAPYKRRSKGRVKLNEVPQFNGVREAYKSYLKKYQRL